MLELNNNLIYRIEDVSVLRKCVPKLEQLSLRSNAICESETYRSHVIRKLPSLQVLDGIPITPLEADDALADFPASITPELIQAHATMHDRFPSLLLSSDGRHREVGGEESGPEANDDWWAGVEELELDHQHLRKLHNLERLISMRRASFCNNELTRIEVSSVRSCPYLLLKRSCPDLHLPYFGF